MKLRISGCADADLGAIWQYIALDDVAAADRVERDLHAAMRLLAEYPGIGHTRPDVNDRRYRFWRVHSYLIAYRVEGDTLFVVRVLHGAHDVRSQLHRGS